MSSELIRHAEGGWITEAQVIGVEEVNRMLDEAPQEVVVEGYLKALQAGSAVIVEELEPRIPIQLRESGGELHVEGGDLKGALVVAITIDANAKGGIVDVGFGKEGYVARFVETGHVQRGHKPQEKLLGSVRPHPFMRPAASAAADRAIAAVAESIEETVSSYFSQEEM